MLHDSMAFNLEGTPLGLVDVQCWARDSKAYGKKHLRHERVIEEKESQKWLKAFRKVIAAEEALPRDNACQCRSTARLIFTNFLNSQ